MRPRSVRSTGVRTARGGPRPAQLAVRAGSRLVAANAGAATSLLAGGGVALALAACSGDGGDRHRGVSDGEDAGAARPDASGTGLAEREDRTARLPCEGGRRGEFSAPEDAGGDARAEVGETMARFRKERDADGASSDAGERSPVPVPPQDDPEGPVDIDASVAGPAALEQTSARASPERARAPDVGEVRFRRTDAGDVSAHVVVNPFIRDEIGYGYGGGLVDVDGDRDLDLLAGSEYGSGPPACIFLNRSDPGHLRFHRDSRWCYPIGAQVLGAVAIDVENDGRDEAIVFGVDLILLERFFPERLTLDLLAVTGAATDGACVAGAALPVDLELDGDLDILVSCRVGNLRPLQIDGPLAWTQENGSFVAAELPEDSPFLQPGNALGYGAIDADRDGLIDLVALEDSFSSIERRNTLWPPGAWYLRCPPGSTCAWRVRPFFDDTSRFGSFMGAGNIRVEGAGELLYLADASPNRLVTYPPSEPEDLAPSLGIQLGWEGDAILFSWGVVVDDLDRNGTDDLFVSQGQIEGSRLRLGPAHYDVAFLQTPEGQFEPLGVGAGLELHASGGYRGLPESVRSCAKGDFDADGTLDLFVTQLDGAPIFYTTEIVPEPEDPRCTLIPRDRYVPVSGYGHAVAGADGIFFRRDMQGQHQLGASPWVLTGETRGELQFASGARVWFDCGDLPGPVEVAEPDWLAIGWSGDAVSAIVDAAALSSAPAPDRFALRRSDGSETVVPATESTGAWTAPAGEEVIAVMVSIDGRWIGRWFARP